MNDSIAYALVTGASSGIGRHISVQLASRGYSILAVSNQPDALNQLKEELEPSFGIKVKVMNIDLTYGGSAFQIFKFCQDNEIRVEVLVNNAGVLIFGEVTEVEVKDTRDILQLHIHTPVLLCRYFAEEMKNRGKGYVLNVSSISSVMSYPTISLYGPTKSFLRQFTRALRIELKGAGVQVLCLIPGATDTQLYDLDKKKKNLALKLGLMKKPEEVAQKGVKALFSNRAECVPGFWNRLILLIASLTPHRFIAFIYRQVKGQLLM